MILSRLRISRAPAAFARLVLSHPCQAKPFHHHAAGLPNLYSSQLAYRSPAAAAPSTVPSSSTSPPAGETPERDWLSPTPSRDSSTIFKLPSLPYDIKNGLPGLYSPRSLHIAWTEYTQFIINKLNRLVAGTNLEGKSSKNIIALTARDPGLASVFNHASMVFNNHFFFRHLSPNPAPMSPRLRQDLEHSFSSIDTLRREFLVTAVSMFGPGFIWLVKTGPAEFGILTTYLAGSPLPTAHWRRQPVDLNTLGVGTSAASVLQSTQAAVGGNTAGAGGTSNAQPPPNGAEVTPLLCLSTWEHAWLPEHGVAGKVKYVEQWWNKIDWAAAEKLMEATRPRVVTTQYRAPM